ncbi:hypothetical protein A3F86_03375 [candidate division WOR-1 bacterium RIFCSPLOWO2_12_FULL_45_9]|uniref:Cell surface protein SprA n=1 Tax=candidate division WOR-1 bacterium RIFCSPLOWO2_12_FULL_45_9 TaxID=1802568 RepID=A0A1F4RJT4_UNCSA|nr:MAG: hypothetical protein A3F86_03375 [candidate division WOR-1 bacterium RIFCSPLOWO2_12_FULL_45_9]
MNKICRLIFFLSVSVVLLSLPSLANQGDYPQVEIGGYKKWEFKKAGVSPASNYFSGLSQLGGYSPTFTGGPWQERLQLQILGQLSENLSVGYDLEQQPETPERYDVKVKYHENELTFGDFSASFTGNEFASVAKQLNGVLLTAKDGWYDIITVPSAKLKSQSQKLSTQKGNNTQGPYSLGHGSILDGSEAITLNNISQRRNIDYTINYFEGKITFTRILTSDDIISYNYEYTNVLDLFFPTLSKRDFFGFQSRFTFNPEEFGKSQPIMEPVTRAMREMYPASVGSAEPTPAEEEASGQYRLKHTPVVNFSEKLTFRGSALKKNEDYIIRYDQGIIKLLTRFLPQASEPLSIEYNYYESAENTESLLGIGSRGPYQLAHDNVVAESERIEVDGKLLTRDLEYSIDNNFGELVFGVVISSTSQIKATYRYKVTAIPAIPDSKFPKELKIGTTYLKESAKKSVGTVTASIIESISGADIINNNYHAYLQNRPITPTTESGANFTVRLDGVELTWEVDYSIPTTQLDSATGKFTVTPEAQLAFRTDYRDPSDGYTTGTIKFLNPLNISAASTIIITYTYYKSVVGKYSGLGDGTRGPYYLRNVRNIAPGTETVQVWEQGSSVIASYTRNASFEANAGDKGYSINYIADTPSITFNNELSATKNYQIIYQYVPPQVFAGGDITHSVIGADGSFKIGDLFTINSAYAKSETDQVSIAETTLESFSGSGTKSYILKSAQDIIEGSEKVSVNAKVLNRDLDYFVSYTKPGQITLYYLTPSSSDAISVEYQFQSQVGLVVGQTVKSGGAFRFGAETKLFGDILSVGGSTKQIDSDFTPMGVTSIGFGSKYKEYNVKLKPNFHSFFTNYSYKENNNPIGASRTQYQNSYDNSVTLGINPRGLAQIDFSYRLYQTLDELASGSSHSGDTAQNSYALSVAPLGIERGIFSLTHKYDLKKSVSESDPLRDSNSFSQTSTDYLHANANLKFTERVTAGFDYQKSEPTTVALRSSSTEATAEALSAHTQSIDTSYNLSVDLTTGPLQKWTARASLLNHEGNTLVKSFGAASDVSATKNQTYHMDLIPFSMLTTSLDHNRQESLTVVVGGTNPKTERTSANINLSPLAWLSGSWASSQSDSVPETGLSNRTTGKANTYNITYKPISIPIFSLDSRFTLSDNNQTAPSGTTPEVTTNTNTFAQNYTATLSPFPILPLSLGLALENYKNANDPPLSASQIDTETTNRTITAGTTLNPLPPLAISTTYNHKTTRVIKDLRVSPSDKKKIIMDTKATYQIAGWGTLTFDQQDEKNGGEIQGGSVADLNIQKVTQTLSLSVTMPVDNPVLTNFVLTGSYKSVDYKNLANTSDNFLASLLSIEGALNF